MKKFFIGAAILILSISSSYADPAGDFLNLCKNTSKGRHIDCQCKASFLADHMSPDELSRLTSIMTALLQSANDKAKAHQIMEQASQDPVAVSAANKMKELDRPLMNACPDKN